MPIAPLPLSYCANVHPALTWNQAKQNFIRYSCDVQRRLNEPVAVGGWLPAAACRDLLDDPAEIDDFARWLRHNQLTVYTMNAFPFGDFHAQRVKENVYRPDWTTAERAEYTCRVADLLARLIPDDVEGSVSTLPLAFAPHHPPNRDVSIYRPRLVEVARYLRSIADAKGKIIRLAIEPEPGCVIETTAQAISFFHSLWRASDGTPDETAVRQHLGLCYDVCHQAVEYEDVPDSISALTAEGVRINKFQLSCAIELRDPTDEPARRQLAAFAEERYLHQTFARHPSGRILKRLDLSAEHALNPSAEWLDCESWRIHFHVPVHRDSMGLLGTTRRQLLEALQAVKRLDYAPHLEVETYTWQVLQSGQTPLVEFDLADGIASELASIRSLQ